MQGIQILIGLLENLGKHVYAYQDSDEAFYENLADKCSNCKTYRCDECGYY